MLVRQVGSQSPHFGVVFKDQIDEQGVLYWPNTRAKVLDLRSQAQSEGSPFQLEGNIVVANTPKE